MIFCEEDNEGGFWMRIKVGNGGAPFLDLQISDSVIILLLLLLFSGGADLVPAVLRLLKF